MGSRRADRKWERSMAARYGRADALRGNARSIGSLRQLLSGQATAASGERPRDAQSLVRQTRTARPAAQSLLQIIPSQIVFDFIWSAM